MKRKRKLSRSGVPSRKLKAPAATLSGGPPTLESKPSKSMSDVAAEIGEDKK